jgi:hypothetical protein
MKVQWQVTAAKAVRLAIPLLNPPAARAKIASIPQGRELDRETTVRALESIGLSADGFA